MLDLDGEDRYLGRFHVGEDGGGHIGKGARGEVFEEECVPLAAEGGELRGEGCGDGFRGAVGDEGDLFAGVDAEAGADR